MPLTELMESDASQTKPDDFFPGLFGAAETDGEIYAAPNDSNPDVLWYDKVALAAAGITEDPAALAESGEWTTDKYLEMNDKLAAAGLTGSMFWNYWATHYSWISAQGGTAYDESGAFVGNSDETTVEAVDTLGKYFQDGTFVVADTMPEGAGADSVFVTHKAGFFSQGRYTIGTVESAGEQDSYDIVRWPTPDGAGGSDRRRHLVPRDQRQDRRHRRRVHVLDRVPERRGPDLPPAGRRQRRAVDQGR